MQEGSLRLQFTARRKDFEELYQFLDENYDSNVPRAYFDLMLAVEHLLKEGTWTQS